MACEQLVADFNAAAAPELDSHFEISLLGSGNAGVFISVGAGARCTGRIEWLVRLQALLISCAHVDPVIQVTLLWKVESCNSRPCTCDCLYKANLLATVWPFVTLVNATARFPYHDCFTESLSPIVITAPLQSVESRMKYLEYSGMIDTHLLDPVIERWPIMPVLNMLVVARLPRNPGLVCSLSTRLSKLAIADLSAAECQCVIDTYGAVAELPLCTLRLSREQGPALLVPASLVDEKTHIISGSVVQASVPVHVQYLEAPSGLSDITADLFLPWGDSDDPSVQGVIVSVKKAFDTSRVPVEHLPLAMCWVVPRSQGDALKSSPDRPIAPPSAVFSIVSYDPKATMWNATALEAASAHTLRRLIQAMRRLRYWPDDAYHSCRANNLVTYLKLRRPGSADVGLLAIAMALDASLPAPVSQALYRCLAVAECDLDVSI